MASSEASVSQDDAGMKAAGLVAEPDAETSADTAASSMRERASVVSQVNMIEAHLYMLFYCHVAGSCRNFRNCLFTFY